MKIISSVAVAVAGVLAAGAASAAPIPYGTAFDVTVFLSGSSAFQKTLETNLNAVATATTLTKFVDTLDGKSFIAYTFNIGPTPPADFANLANKNVILYYRLKGGSVWAPGPQALNKAVATLAKPASPTCAALTTFPATTACTVNAAYALNTDGPAPQAGLQYAVPQWGISDVNSEALTGENWVSNTSGAGALGLNAPNYAGLKASTKPLFSQVFSVVVNSTGPAAGLSSLSKQDLTAIFSGAYADWSQVPDAARTGTLAAGGIKICRRDPGSGTQTLASVFFNGTNCSTASFPFPTPTSIHPNDTGAVVQNNSTGNLLDCVNANAGAIGFAVLDSTQAQMTNNGGHVKVVGYDGTVPSKTNAANGSYEYFAEAVSITLPSLAAGNTKTFITDMQNRLQDVTTISASDNAVAIPNLVSGNSATIPVTVVSGTPVALATTTGNVCSQPQANN